MPEKIHRYKHSNGECTEVLRGIKNILRQIKSIEHEPLRKELCESATELCEQLLREKEDA